jgi:patatin-like phospholipase/acyl hydrolase
MAINILSIDGGGIKGIIPARILSDVELMIKQVSGNPNKTIADCFDLIAGTSTGGILATGLLIPDENGKAKYSAKDLLEMYMTRGDEIFDISLWQKIRSGAGITDEKYDNEELKDALNDYFGETELKDLLKPTLITAYNIKARKGEFFNQMDAKANEKYNFLAKDIAYSTAAAPTYFQASKIKSKTNIPYVLIDGGVFANNPALCAYSEVRNKFQGKPTAKDMNIISIGTGYVKESYSYKEAKDWGLIEWAKPLISIMMSGVSETVDYQLKQIFDTIPNPDQYLRINDELEFASSEMDDASFSNMSKLEKDGERIANNHKDQLKDMIERMCDNN